MENILSAVEEILGTAVRVEDHRDWAIFWCPFHNDASREGKGGQPNFGVNLQSGYWKCLRCGAIGDSLKSLRTKLGQDWKPSVSVMTPTRVQLIVRMKILDELVIHIVAKIRHLDNSQ